ncbi:uncharacterized protein LOC133300942 [Gastrolobium bilobum]|uniref:uncharacterized protein LOC133300942 n=1 Tax=Gastrolobium bilobum TaxID=150636 RepID=UPI002AB08748|nr:uncharacterized protein LOC133300942 [Gastrolobium bilobum]
MAASTLKITDPKSPFYLHPSDHPGVILTTVLLRGQSNYENWSKLMSNALKAKNKLGFVDNSVTQPSDASSDEAHAWSLCNSMINSWIHNTIDPQMQPFIKCFDTAKNLWDDLKECFAQNGVPVTDYYTQLRSIWDELESSRKLIACASGDTCAFTKSVTAELEHDRVYQFLIGLDHHIYGTLITQILNSNPLPTINRVFAMVIQEESHKAMVRTAEIPYDALGCALHTAPLDPSKARIICSHCGRPNHDASRCYKLHGYPDRMTAGRGRGRGRSNPGRSAHASAHATYSDALPPPTGVPKPLSATDLTPDMVQQLMSLAVSSKATTDKLSGIVSFPHPWLLDSGASQHMTGTLSFLTNIRVIPPCSVGLPNGTRTAAVQCGDVQLTSTLLLTNDLQTRRTIGKGVEHERVYVFHQAFSANKVSGETSSTLWHRRLGHPSQHY